jgi:hypothetical protein
VIFLNVTIDHRLDLVAHLCPIPDRALLRIAGDFLIGPVPSRHAIFDHIIAWDAVPQLLAAIAKQRVVDREFPPYCIFSMRSEIGTYAPPTSWPFASVVGDRSASTQPSWFSNPSAMRSSMARTSPSSSTSGSSLRGVFTGESPPRQQNGSLVSGWIPATAICWPSARTSILWTLLSLSRSRRYSAPVSSLVRSGI